VLGPQGGPRIVLHQYTFIPRVEAHRAVLFATARTPSFDSIARAAEGSSLVVAFLAHLRVEVHRAVLFAAARTPSFDSIARAAEGSSLVVA
jgi:hypothetical protein